MAEKIKRHISHLKSSGGTAPAATALTFGEIAVGYLKGKETLYIKNNSGDVVSFVDSAQGQALAELYADKHDVSTVTGTNGVSVTLSDVADSGRTITVSHSTDAGYKHIPSGGSSGQVLGWDSAGAAKWVNATANTNYYTSALTVSTSVSSNTITVSGNNSAVKGTAVLSGATTSKAGLMASADKTALNNLNPLSGKVSTLSAITATSAAINSLTGSVGSMAFQNTGNYVPTGRTITTASGLTGGGDLGSNLTIGHSNNITAGSAKTSSSSVTATPSGSNIAIPIIAFDSNGHITKSDSTNVSLKVNSATTGTAGVVKIATTTGTNNTDVVMTQSAVTKAIEDSFTAQDAMRYKGTLTGKTQFESLANYSVGDTYKVATAFTTTAGVKLEVGDMVIAQSSGSTFSANDFNYIQANLDPTAYAVATRKVTGTGALGGGGDLSADRTITHNELAPNGASGQTSPNEAQTPGFNETFNVPVITYDKYGHIISAETTTVKIPNSASTWTRNYYTSALTVSTSVSSNTITVSGNNSAVKGTAVLSGATTSKAGLMTSADKTALNNLNPLSGKVSTLSAITATSAAINSLTGSVGSMAFQNTGSYSSATQVNSALSGKVGTGRKVSTGAGLTGGGDLTADRTIKAALSSETKSTLSAATMGTTANRQYAVGLDANGVLSVNVPWENNTYTGYDIVFSNSGGTTVDTYKALTSPSKILKAGSSINMTASSNVITIDLGNIECGDYA